MFTQHGHLPGGVLQTYQNFQAHQIYSLRVLLLYCRSLPLHKGERVGPMVTTASIRLLDRVTGYGMEWLKLKVLHSKFQTLNLLQVY